MEKELLINLATKAYNKTPDEIEALIYAKDDEGNVTINPQASELLLSLDSNRIQSLKDRQTELITAKVNETTAKINTSWENTIKSKYGITDDVRGEELLTKLDERMTAAAGTDGKGKTSKEYLELEQRYKQLETDLSQKYVPKSELEKFVFKTERETRVNSTIEQAEKIRQALPLIYPEDPTIRMNIEKSYIQTLMQKFDDIEQTEDGKIYLKKGGNRIENANGYAVELSEIVAETARGFFSFAKQQPTGNGGNGNGAAGTNDLALLKQKLSDPNVAWAERVEIHKKIAELQKTQ